MTDNAKLKLPAFQVKRFQELVKTGGITETIFQAFLDQNDAWKGRILPIDRTQPFDLVNFYSDNHHFKIWRGDIGCGGYFGEERQSKRALVLTEVDFCRVFFESFSFDSETEYYQEKFEEGIERHKNSGPILADAQIGWTLLKEPRYKTLEHLYKKYKVKKFVLLGTILGWQDWNHPTSYEPEVLIISRNRSDWWERDITGPYSVMKRKIPALVIPE
jgi:hypothetical protein